MAKFDIFPEFDQKRIFKWKNEVENTEYWAQSSFRETLGSFRPKKVKIDICGPPYPFILGPEIGKNSIYKHFQRLNSGFWVKKAKTYFDEMKEVLRL